MNEYARVEHALACRTSAGAIGLANKALHPTAGAILSRRG
jgi:hypothetical protein